VGFDEIVFLFPGHENLAGLRRLDVDRDWRHFTTGLSAWVLQTYLRLHERGLPVQLTDRMPNNGIVVMHAHSGAAVQHAGIPPAVVVVGVRADKPAQHFADFEIVQNNRSADGRSFAVPHWPQPGLLARDAQRGHLLGKAGYKGHLKMLNPALRSTAWEEHLRQAGIAWCCDAVPFGGPGSVYQTVAWNDYQRVDAVVAVRPEWRGSYPTKPATKLVNAWLAGVPAVLGPEDAYRELRRGRLDYLEVRSLTEAERAVDRLATDSGLYLDMVANGRTRASAFTAEEVAQRWATLLFEDLPRALAAGGGRRAASRRSGLRGWRRRGISALRSSRRP